MTGGTAAHAIIRRNPAFAWRLRLLRGGSCDVFGSDLKFPTAQGAVRYPKGQVACGPVDLKGKWVENPAVVFEVLSPSITKIDRIGNARDYEAAPSVQH